MIKCRCASTVCMSHFCMSGVSLHNVPRAEETKAAAAQMKGIILGITIVQVKLGLFSCGTSKLINSIL